MFSRSLGALERECSNHATDQTTNVPAGIHDHTSNSPRSLSPADTVHLHGGHVSQLLVVAKHVNAKD